MLLPRAASAEIDSQKLHAYLLSPSHPIGRFKARFFAALGYSVAGWQALDRDLRAQHLTQDAVAGDETTGGRLFTIRAILKGPNGDSALVRSVWFVPAGGGPPRFVTAYPGGSK